MNVIVCWKRCDVVLENDNEVDSVELNEWKRMTREWNKDNIVWIVRISCSLVENHCFLHFISWSIPLDDLNDNHHYHNQSDDNTNDKEFYNNPYSTINTQVQLYVVMQLWWIETQTK